MGRIRRIGLTLFQPFGPKTRPFRDWRIPPAGIDRTRRMKAAAARTSPAGRDRPVCRGSTE
jgi:hypothetical protein